MILGGSRGMAAVGLVLVHNHGGIGLEPAGLGDSRPGRDAMPLQ